MVIGKQKNTKEKKMATKEQKELEVCKVKCKVMSDSMYTCRELAKVFRALARTK